MVCRPAPDAARSFASDAMQPGGPMPVRQHAAHEISQILATMEALSSSGPLTMERVARELHTSSRTLQRRLHENDVSFRELQANMRHKIASELLRGTEIPVQDIARRLGYRKPGAFARAFARWTGRTPLAYRRADAP